MNHKLRQLWEGWMRRLPWVNPYGKNGRPAMPEAHALANRLTETTLRRQLLQRSDLQRWEGRARWDAWVQEREPPHEP